LIARRKVTGLSAARGKNKDKKSSLCFVNAKKYEGDGNMKIRSTVSIIRLNDILLFFGQFYLLSKEISILSAI